MLWKQERRVTFRNSGCHFKCCFEDAPGEKLKKFLLLGRVTSYIIYRRKQQRPSDRPRGLGPGRTDRMKEGELETPEGRLNSWIFLLRVGDSGQAALKRPMFDR